MGKKKHLIDSNVVIDFLAGRLPDRGRHLINELINEIPNLSVITKIELLGFNASKKRRTNIERFYLPGERFCTFD